MILEFLLNKKQKKELKTMKTYLIVIKNIWSNDDLKYQQCILYHVFRFVYIYIYI